MKDMATPLEKKALPMDRAVDTQTLSGAFAAAAPGAVLEGELVPVVGRGKVRVTYDWLYSALNCDPADASPFGWVIYKTGRDAVALSPRVPYRGLRLYASVRPDWFDFVQVQAPHSADWITAVGADEAVRMSELGFLTVNLRGRNGRYLAVDAAPTRHHGHAGYKLQSTATSPGPATNMFVAVTRVLQRGLAVPLAASLDQAVIRAALAARGAADPGLLARRIAAAVR